ncbi:MAG: hypothetical protein ACKVX7_15240 [Planctomycetota bacterium]
MHTRFGIMAMAFALSLALTRQGSAQPQILYYDNLTSAAVADTLAVSAPTMGFTYTTVTTQAALDAELTGGTNWALVIIASSGNNLDSAELNTYINARGKAIVAYWNLDADATLQAALDVTVASSFSTPLAISRWVGTAEFAPWYSLGPFSLVGLSTAPDMWGDNGDRLNTTGSSVAIGGFTATPAAGEAAIVIGNEGRTICIGHELDGLNPSNVQFFMTSSIRFMLQKRVLHYTDATTYSTTSGDALLDEGLNRTRVTTPSSFNTMMTGPIEWELVVVESAATTLVSAAPLSDYIEAGGKALVSYWNLDAEPGLQNVLGVSSATDFTAPMPIYEWPAVWPHSQIWNVPNSVPATINASADQFIDNGDRLTVDTGTALAGFVGSPTIGQAAVVVSNSGSAICIGHDYVSLSGGAIFSLVQNCIHYLCEPPRQILLFDNNSDHAAQIALSRQNLPFTRTTNSGDFIEALNGTTEWDYVVVNNSSSSFDGVPLADYIDDGGKALVSYWNLDAEPELQTALRVTNAVDFTLPLQINDWGALTSAWSIPNVVPFIGAGPDVWADNGDRLTMGDAQSSGGFTSGPVAGQAAVVIGNGSDTICIGHETDGLAQGQISDFIENCVYLQCPPPPLNDYCFNATQVFDGETVFGTLIGATNDVPVSCAPTLSNPDVWYRFTAPAAGTLTVSTCGTHDQYGLDDGVDTVLAIYSSCGGGGALACNDDAGLGNCGSLSASNQFDSRIVRTMAAGENVRIQVSNYSTSSRVGPIVLNVDFNASLPGSFFRRADSNADGAVNIADGIYTLNWLFVPASPSPTCMDAADANDDGSVNIADGIYTLNWLFVPASPPPPSPHPLCSTDPSADALNCAAYGVCF